MNHCRLLVLLWWWGHSVSSGSDWCHKQGRYYKPGQALAEELLTIIIRPWPPVPMTDEAKKDDVWSVENNTSLLWQCLSDGGSRQANLASPHTPPFSLFNILHLMTSTCTLTMLCADTFVWSFIIQHSWPGTEQSAQACGRDSVVAASTQLTQVSSMLQSSPTLPYSTLATINTVLLGTAGQCSVYPEAIQIRPRPKLMIYSWPVLLIDAFHFFI